MISDTHTDIEMLRDGSRRWLWQVHCGERLWQAGIVSQLPLAESEANRSLRELNAKLAPPKQGQSAEQEEAEPSQPSGEGEGQSTPKSG